MGDYIDWDYSESIAGVPASMVGYSADGSKKRRGAQTGFDTNYTDSSDDKLFVLSSRISTLSDTVATVNANNIKLLATAAGNTNLVANGDFSQWSASPTVWGGFNLLITSTPSGNHYRMNGYAFPLADRWYHVAQTGALVVGNTGVKVQVSNPAVVQNPDGLLVVQSKKAMQAQWTSTGTLSLYAAGDNYLKSSAMFAVQHMIQDVTKFANKTMMIGFKVKGDGVGTGFVQIYRQYNLTRPTPNTTSSTTFSQSVKPPGLELIMRQQFSYTSNWSQIQYAFVLGSLLGTSITDKENGLVIQIGPLFYHNTKTTTGSIILEQYGNAGGSTSFFKTGGGSVTLAFADVMLYEGSSSIPYTVRDEAPYTTPWVCYLGAKYDTQPPMKKKVLALGQTCNQISGESQLTSGGAFYQSVYQLDLPYKMATPPTNILWHYQNYEAWGIDAALSMDQYYGDYKNGGGSDPSFMSAPYDDNGVAPAGRLMSQSAWPYGIFVGENWINGSSIVNRYCNLKNIATGANPIRFYYHLYDSDPTRVQLMIGTLSTANSYMPGTYLGGGASYLYCDDINDSWRSWMIFYARETSWGPMNEGNVPTDTEAKYHLGSATTSFVFPGQAIL